MGSHYNHQAFHAAKRDMDDNKYHFIHMAGRDAEGDNNGDGQGKVITITKQVYVTEPKTFPGPATYVTKMPFVETIAANPSMNSYESAKSVINQPKTRSGNPYLSPTSVKGEPISNGEISNQSPGMSGGQKAGVAFGVIAAIALVAGLVFFCMRRRKQQLGANGEKLDEKHYSQTSFFSGTAAAMGAPAGDKRASVKSFRSTHSAATAPRLSLRPVTQFLPSILDKSNSNKQLNVPSMSEKPRSASPQNPFAEGADKPSNPFDEANTAAAVPAAPRQNNVHRVQLDFKPSMDDEIELKSGQLVRMVHEYDDGWALCMRMDRTQQGVCPRTCLSKVPVKPRPQGAPNGRNSPSGARGPSPQPTNQMMPRPLTPNGRERASTGGPSSPAPADTNRNRSQSVTAGAERPVSPIDGSVPARKPVAGQAI